MDKTIAVYILYIPVIFMKKLGTNDGVYIFILSFNVKDINQLFHDDVYNLILLFEIKKKL
jgi:hypothetical protein